jgi:hypothetical protein
MLKKGEGARKPPRLPPDTSFTLKEEPLSVDPHCMEEEGGLSSEDDELVLTVESQLSDEDS